MHAQGGDASPPPQGLTGKIQCEKLLALFLLRNPKLVWRSIGAKMMSDALSWAACPNWQTCKCL